MKNYLSEILDNLDVIVYVADLKTYELLYINEYTRKLFGDIEGNICWQSLQKGQDGPCSFCTNDRIVNSEGKPAGIYHWEFQNTVTGQWFDIRDTAIEWTDSRIVRLEIATDITKHKKTEEALVESEKKYHSLVSNIPSVTWITDSDGKTTFISPNVEKIYGYTPEEIYQYAAKLWFERIHPEDVKKVEEAYNNLFKKKRYFNIEYRIKRKDGKWIWLHDRAVTTYEKDGLQFAYGVFDDITGRKQNEERLKEREQYLQSIINTEPECVKIVLGDGTLMQMNPAGLRMIEADSIEQVKGKSVYHIVAPKYQDAFRELTESVCLGNKGSLEFEIIGLKGTHRWLETHAVSLRNAQNEIIGLLGVTRDITEHKKALEEIKQLNKELEGLIYTTSHDLRSPLVNIHGYSGEFLRTCDEIGNIIENEAITPSLRSKLTPLIKDNSISMTYIDSSVKKMDSLLAGLLKLSRTGRTELQVEELDMNSLMNDILKTVKFQIKETGVKVEIEELPPCKGDKERINQVFSNLLNNALKYLDKGREGNIKVSGSKKHGDSIYCLEDNGIGIAPEHHKKIFEIFYQLDPSRNDDEGLGLAIVNKIIRMHRGKVWVESELGKGSKFFVSFPA
jgi:PAS domain S-box-containing protein